jgi:predicted 3-demethylubiquinone-9 3-methyltransferase (glyoxalase superfamily)
MPGQTASAFLWFDDQAEDAARFYISIFERIGSGCRGRSFRES